MVNSSSSCVEMKIYQSILSALFLVHPRLWTHRRFDTSILLDLRICGVPSRPPNTFWSVCFSGGAGSLRWISKNGVERWQIVFESASDFRNPRFILDLSSAAFNEKHADPVLHEFLYVMERQCIFEMQHSEVTRKHAAELEALFFLTF